jgi:hypothetical protein
MSGAQCGVEPGNLLRLAQEGVHEAHRAYHTIRLDVSVAEELLVDILSTVFDHMQAVSGEGGGKVKLSNR